MDGKKWRSHWRRRVGALAVLCTLVTPLVTIAGPGTASASGSPLWQCPFGGPTAPIDPNYVAYVRLYSLVSSTPTFDVGDTRTVINDTDFPAMGTFTSLRSRTFALTIGVGASANNLLDFLTVNVSASIMLSVTTQTSVSTTAQVPPHSQLIGEYGVQAFDVTYDITTYQILAHVACKAVGVQRNTTNAPTNIQGWRLRLA